LRGCPSKIPLPHCKVSRNLNTKTPRGKGSEIGPI
jgi:hypothetical protein